MNIILDNKFVRVFHKPGLGNTTLISFSGIDFDIFGLNNLNKEALDRPEFTHIPDGVGDRFWIIDKQRQWGNTIDWIFLASFLREYLENKQVVLLGSCLGGHNAVKFSHYVDVHRVIAFTPHWSIHPDEITQDIFDHRTVELRALTIHNMVHKSLSGLFNLKTEYLFFWSPDVVDVPHMLCFPSLPNIKKIYFPNSNHSIARMLSNKGLLYDIIDEAIIDKDPHRKISLILERKDVAHELY